MSSPANAHYQQIALELIQTDQAASQPFSLRVIGRSMAPLLRPGDKVIAQHIQADLLKRGDLIVIRQEYQQEKQLTTHRLIATDTRGWHTKGDSCLHADPPIPAQAILGRVIAIERSSSATGNFTQIDLQRRQWIFANRLMGWLGRLQTSLFQPNQRNTTLARAASVPFRILAGLILLPLTKL